MRNIFLFIIVAIISLTANAQITVNKIQESSSTLKINQPLAEINKSETFVPDKAIEANENGVKKALTGNYREAVSDFQKSVEIAPNCLQCRYNLARALIHTENFDSAIEILEKVLKEKSDYGLVFAAMGEVYYEKGDIEKSVEYYRKAVKLLPDDAVTISNLGVSLQYLGKYDESLEVFDNSFKLNPKIAATANNRGVSYYHKGKIKEAVRDFRLAISIDSKFPQSYNNLGVALDRMGKSKEAYECYIQALRLKPDWNYAQFNLALNQIERGDRTGAYKMLSSLEKHDVTLADNLRNQLRQRFIVDVSAFR